MTTSVEVVEVEAVAFPWWLVLLEGIAALIIGLLLIASPQKSILVLVQLLGIYWLIKGMFNIIAIFIDSSAWGWKLFAGIIGIIAGILVLQNPLWSGILVPSLMIWILGLQAIVVGVIAIVQSFRGAGWGAAILGIISILVGIFFVANTLIGLQLVVILSAILMIIGGIAAIVMAFKLK